MRSERNVCLTVSKTKKMAMDFRKNIWYMTGAVVDKVTNLKFLGVHITGKRTRTRGFKKLGLSRNIFTSFILSGCITGWFGCYQSHGPAESGEGSCANHRQQTQELGTSSRRTAWWRLTISWWIVVMQLTTFSSSYHLVGAFEAYIHRQTLSTLHYTINIAPNSNTCIFLKWLSSHFS